MCLREVGPNSRGLSAVRCKGTHNRETQAGRLNNKITQRECLRNPAEIEGRGRTKGFDFEIEGESMEESRQQGRSKGTNKCRWERKRDMGVLPG